MGSDNKLEKLKLRIKILEAQLEEARTHTYIGETDSLHCSDGELYIGYDDNKALVIEVDQLFRDLPSIISMVTKEQKKMQQMHLKMIKEALV